MFRVIVLRFKPASKKQEFQMKALLAAALLLVGAIAWAEEQNSAPSKDADHSSSTTDSGSKQADKSNDKLPNPGELIRRIKEMEKAEAKKTRIAFFDLSSRPVTEQPASFSIFGDDGSMTLRSIIDRLHQAR